MTRLTIIWSIVVLAVLIESQLAFGRALMPVARDSEEVNGTATDSKGKEPDYFANNVLEDLFQDNRVTARIDSTVLDGNMLSMSGVVTYQIVNTHPNITDEADMAGKSGSSALIIQAELGGDHLGIKWIKRSCACSTDAKFVVTSTNEGDEVWVAGSTTGIDRGEEGTTEPGMALMRYNSQGKQLLLRQLGAAGENYNWVGYTSSANNGTRNVTLVGAVNSERFEGLEKALVAEVVNASGHIVKTGLISDGENVVGETFWSAESLGSTLYVVGKRSVQAELTPTSTLTLTKMDTEKMKVMGVRDFENELQRAIVLCADSQGITASYVARNNNQGHVIVEEMDDKLVNMNRTKVKIQRDLVYQKAVKSVMVACDQTRSPPVLLMNTAEALNQTASDWEEKRKLNNQRPALLAVKDNTFVSISQSQRSTEWLASGMVGKSGSSNWIIVGKTGNGKPLLSSGRLVEPKQAKVTPSPSPNITTSGPECIGEETTISGRPVLQIIGGHDAMRLQRHPLRRRLIANTLCRRIGADELCATPQHVVQVGDEALFMRDWCARTRDCHIRRQRVLNFKAPCGITLPPAEDGSRLTMHSGGARNADALVREECHLQSRSFLHRAWWWLKTL